MIGWLEGAGNSIAGFFTGAGSTVGRWIRDAVLGVFHFFLGITDRVGGAWDWMLNGVEWFGQQVGDWAAVVYNTFAHILGTVIPDAISKAFHDAVTWATGAIDWLHKHVIHPLDLFAHGILRWAQKAWHDLEQFARSIWQDVKRLLDWVATGAAKAVDMVLHPDKLVAWVLAHVTLPLIRLWIHLWMPVVLLVLRAGGALVYDVAKAGEEILADLL